MQFGLAFGLVGVYGANVLFGFHLVASFHGDVFEVGIHREVLAVPNDDYRVGACLLGDAGHFAVEDSSCFGAVGGGDVDAIVGHGDFV